MKMISAWALLSIALALGSSCALAQSEQKATPPGVVLMQACEQINSSDPSTRAMIQRTSCIEFLSGILSMDRYTTMKQRGAPLQKPSEVKSQTYCYPHSHEWAVNGLIIASAAKGLAAYLRTLPASQLDRRDQSDDTRARLVLDYLEKTYPCKRYQD